MSGDNCWNIVDLSKAALDTTLQTWQVSSLNMRQAVKMIKDKHGGFAGNNLLEKYHEWYYIALIASPEWDSPNKWG